ncbi:Single-stranded DNA-binding replication protein A (RPA), large (70 kD) subunit or related ssDNA-binding protein [Halapricum desulfuricans]|uniref:Single-stranded DNA-binding replication protein A (RPA), large (70 kD) subunit or related ssDNA-binding protein n=1 Tax=Halapricum desulfuricans TaxID=2841257 RepID=A0A897NFA2_9EURY|nr:single-stranded DNA binding protein [Halapricum desulfuricans]QSG13110.1 Single-stranded DNA-binding replication protein A (RPA), large (70 kD) subunit or related ssDNA-binding protein [Halapricum desulfuricans]
MGAIEDVYADLEADVSGEEFREAVEQKVEQMGGLADEETAAMLIAHELSENEVNAIADIEPGMDEVKFLAKVTSIGELRTFERDGDDEDGRVINVEAADETGQVRLSFWDEQARSIDDGELQAGDVLRVKGRPKDGYSGLEVSVDKAEPDEDAEIEVDLDGRTDVDSLSMGQSDVNVRGIVLDTESVRTFDRDDGSEGRVANLTLGDESGRIRVTLWDDRADRAEELEAGTPVEVVDGYVRERDGSLELHVGDRGAVEAIDDEIDFSPETDPIGGVELDQTVDIGGVVRSADPKRMFDRDDGSEGQVRNVRIQDDTGDIRVALWGEKADIDLGPGDEVFVADAEIQDGWQDDLEASAGWGSAVVVLEDGSGAGAASNGDSGGASSESSTGLDAFADDRGTDDGSEPAGVGSDDSDGTGGEQIEVTGTVVQTGDPVIVDDGEETISVETDEHVQLGQQVTVRGQRRADRVDAEELF